MEKEMFLVTFDDGTEFVTFTEDDITEQFGVGGYTVQKGIWKPTEEQE